MLQDSENMNEYVNEVLWFLAKQVNDSSKIEMRYELIICRHRVIQIFIL
jgi:hypothetical protein